MPLCPDYAVVGEVIDGDQVVAPVAYKVLCANFLPESFWQPMAYEALPSVVWSVRAADFAQSNEFHQLSVPCQKMLSLARLRHPSVPMWDLCISWNDQTVDFGDKAIVVDSECMSDSVIRGQGG